MPVSDDRNRLYTLLWAVYFFEKEAALFYDEKNGKKLKNRKCREVAEKLYYQDAYLKEFSGKIVKQGKDGNREYVILDQTAFYPTGGGQPHDTGTINGVNVTDVEEADGEIKHYLETPLAEEQKDVQAEINWERRFDHMQQHAGQHILSAAFDQLFHYKTVSFHLGKETLTIDLNTESLTEAEAQEAEKLANQIIMENRPIEPRWVTPEELSSYPLRKETKVKENIRLVIIPEFDYNGCGGTHPRATGEVRAVKILNWERQKKQIRVQFVCGERVLSQFGQKQQVLLELTKLLNAPEQDMPATVVKLLDVNKQLEKAHEQARDLLLAFEAKELLAEAKPMDNQEVAVSRVFQNRPIQELQKLARAATSVHEQANVFFVAENEDRLQIVLARGMSGAVNMKEVMNKTLARIGGKGGGNASFAQGGGSAALSGGELLDFIEKIAAEG